MGVLCKPMYIYEFTVEQNVLRKNGKEAGKWMWTD
jgi:hypothetical protein